MEHNVLECPLVDGEPGPGFDCGNSSISDMIEQSYFATLIKQANGYKIKLNEEIIGYYMIHFKSVELEFDEDYQPVYGESPYAAVHIKYLAIASKYQHQHIGKRVLQGLIINILKFSKKYPIRLITIDAVAEYHEWYKKIGFKDFPKPDKTKIAQGIYPMYIDCISPENEDKLQQMVESNC